MRKLKSEGGLSPAASKARTDDSVSLVSEVETKNERSEVPPQPECAGQGAREAQIVHPICATCGKPATCLGRYESDEKASYACDDCCGHGEEDGRCTFIEQPASPPATEAATLRAKLQPLIDKWRFDNRADGGELWCEAFNAAEEMCADELDAALEQK